MSEQQRLSPGTATLLPCPFCNRRLEHDPKISATFHPKIAYDEYCPLKGFLFASDRSDIIDAWNTRCVAQAESMARLSASEVACYRWPEDTTEHRAMRAAFCDGAALSAVTPSPVAGEGEQIGLRALLTGIIDAESEFRESMGSNWEGDPLSDAIDAARRFIETPAIPSTTRGTP